MGNKLTIAFTRREAELYRSQGLFEEAQQLYRDVLSNADTLGGHLSQSLREQILTIEEELAALEVDLVDFVSDRDMNILKRSWRGADTTNDILTCATALGDIGLFEAGVEEYCRLIRRKLPVTRFIRGLTDCLLGIHSEDTLHDAIENIINQALSDGRNRITMRAAFALDMERRGYGLTALRLYKTLLKEVPQTHWAAIARRITALKSKMKTQATQSAKGGKPPSIQPVNQSARFQRRIGRLRRHLHQLRTFLRRQRFA